MDGAVIDRLTLRVLDALAGGQPITPAALLLLLHRYVATGRTDVGDALGPALAQAIDRCTASDRPGLQGEMSDTPDVRVGPTYDSDTHDQRAEWLMVLVEAEAVADDDRVAAATQSLVNALRAGWPSRGRVQSAMQSIDACLMAASRHTTDATLIGASIDELERVVSASYEPGEGLAALIQLRSSGAGDLRDHVAAASTLLSAYNVTARLPYSMLAEELMQFARRSWWDDEAGGFSHARAHTDPEAETTDRFVGNAEAARVLCRLAALHQDADYRAAAVIARAADYLADARRTLESLAPLSHDRGLDVAVYGVALSEWLAATGRSD